MKFVLSPVDSLDPCRHFLYTFLDVLSYHSNGVSEVAAAKSRSSIDRARNRSVGSLQTAVAASFLVRFSKPKYPRLDHEKTFPMISYL